MWPNGFDRGSLKRMYQDREQSSSPPSKQARREDPQRGVQKSRNPVLKQ